MKKIFSLLAAVLIAAGTFAGNYGILVNGKTYFAGEPADEFEGFQQYLAHVQLKSGDYCQLCDADNKAVWAVDLNKASVSGFTRDGDKYNVSTDGCFDFYIKLKYGADELYIGNGSNCGSGIDISGQGGGQGGNQGGNDGGSSAVGHEFYAIGWINGADSGEAAYDKYDDNYKFVDGKLAIDCKMGSYIAMKDYDGNFYYSRKQTTINDSKVTLEWANGWAGCEKWAIPEGVNYIIIRSIKWKGNIELERVDKATFDAYKLVLDDEDAVENTTIKANTIKTIENGQVVIIKDGIRYNLLGAQLQ
ncbi:MAG: hypothetical protein J5688_05745 [Paludibacteraceae bacterium]|nr:hypothetical protein [Paludibacteraceae bacterium]